jgi:twitching motility protein PilT
VFNQRGAVGAVYRLIPEKIRSFGDLGLPPVIANLSERPRGLVLVTGRPAAASRPRWRP